jgi:hypothetical protein
VVSRQLLPIAAPDHSFATIWGRPTSSDIHMCSFFTHRRSEDVGSSSCFFFGRERPGGTVGSHRNHRGPGGHPGEARSSTIPTVNRGPFGRQTTSHGSPMRAHRACRSSRAFGSGSNATSMRPRRWRLGPTVVHARNRRWAH